VNTIRLFPDRERFLVLVSSAKDGGVNDVDVEVEERDGNFTHPKQRMTWERAYEGFATELEQNEHQLSAMANGLNRGKVLKFYLDCRRDALVKAGFLRGAS